MDILTITNTEFKEVLTDPTLLVCQHCWQIAERKKDKHGRLVLQQRFCSRECQIAARPKYSSLRPTYHCAHCGKVCQRERRTDGKGWLGVNRFCSLECRSKGVMSVAVGKGQGYLDKHGYVLVAGVPEHRTVMERVMGRKLTPEETVHHKDGNRTNNDPANLELWDTRHGKGQRVEDRLAWCMEYIASHPEIMKELGHKLVVDAITLSTWDETKFPGKQV
jgi:hypothetical protein